MSCYLVKRSGRWPDAPKNYSPAKNTSSRKNLERTHPVHASVSVGDVVENTVDNSTDITPFPFIIDCLVGRLHRSNEL